MATSACHMILWHPFHIYHHEASMARNLLSIIMTWLAVAVTPPTAFAFSKYTDTVTDASVRRLLRLMDKDKSGTVSKNEFMNYFSERFDRLDVDHNRRLKPNELRPMLIPNWAIRPKSSKDQM
jgi:Ca2+-binding EF-hand superfamily protein